MVGSSAVQMNQRALDQERVRLPFTLFLKHYGRLDRRGKWRKQNERQNELIGLLKSWTNGYMRQLIAKEQQFKARKRANSESTEVPFIGDRDIPTEVFNGARWRSV